MTGTHDRDEFSRPIGRIAVIGDLHSEHVRFAHALDWIAGAGVDALICTGDIADGRGCVNASCELLRQSGAIVVAGNHDRWLLEDRVRHIPDAHRRHDLEPDNLAFLAALPKTAELETIAGRLLLCHGVGENDLGKVWPGTPRSRIERSLELDQLIDDGRVRFLINGHLHYRVLIDFPDFLLLNAGTLKSPHAGFAIVDFRRDCVASLGFDGNERPYRLIDHTLSASPGRRVWRDTQEFDGTWLPLALHGQ